MQKNYSETLKRTVIVQSECLPREVINVFKEIELIYKRMLEEIVEYALKNNARSRKKLHQAFYKRFREKIPIFQATIFMELY